MREATLCFLIKEDGKKKNILLAMKKRGFGVGKWNGVGGKFDREKGDKTIEDAIKREVKEEIGVKVKNLEKVALLNFRFPYNSLWNQRVHVFLSREWEGDPQETEEMAPKWFSLENIPFKEMWDDDPLWFPLVLAGKKIEGEFVFEEGEKVKEYNIKEI